MTTELNQIDTVTETATVNQKETEMNQNDTQTETTTPEPIQYRITSTGRVTLVGTRKCTECGRHEFHTKKYDTNPVPENLNTRYTLCKGVCVYCYASKRNKSTGTSLTENQLKAKIQYYTDLLAKTAGDEFNAS